MRREEGEATLVVGWERGREARVSGRGRGGGRFVGGGRHRLPRMRLGARRKRSTLNAERLTLNVAKERKERAHIGARRWSALGRARTKCAVGGWRRPAGLIQAARDVRRRGRSRRATRPECAFHRALCVVAQMGGGSARGGHALASAATGARLWGTGCDHEARQLSGLSLPRSFWKEGSLLRSSRSGS
jgi:hypothetical protein